MRPSQMQYSGKVRGNSNGDRNGGGDYNVLKGSEPIVQKEKSKRVRCRVEYLYLERTTKRIL